jgi:hypothetical protein
MAWRILQTKDYVEMMRDGTSWTENLGAIGWKSLKIDNPPQISGQIMCRGNMYSPSMQPDKRGSGNRLSWYMATLLWCIAAEKKVDFVVSHAHEHIVENGMQDYLYGYAHHLKMPKHYWPWFGVEVPAYMVWSSASDVGDYLLSQRRFHRLGKYSDLRETVTAFTAHRQAEKSTVNFSKLHSGDK